MIKILHLADLHLGWDPRFLGTGAAVWRQERDSVFSAVVDYALVPGNGIGLVLIVGDLFDHHNPDQALVEQVLRQLRRLVDHGVRVVTVPGNHDEITYPDAVYRQRTNSWPGMLVRNPHPDHVASLDVGGETCHIYSLAYTGGLTKTSPPISDFPHNREPGWHIAAFHGSLDWDAGDRSLPLSGASLGQAGYDYVALGHLHKPLTTPLTKGMAVYPGSLSAKGWNDPGTGQLTVVTLAGEGVRVDRVPLDHPACRGCRIIEVDVGRYQTPEDLASSLTAQIRQDEMVLLRLTGAAHFPINQDWISGSLAGACYHLEVEDLTDARALDMLDTWAGENTLRGYFVRGLQARLTAAQDDRERWLITRSLAYGLTALGGE